MVARIVPILIALILFAAAEAWAHHPTVDAGFGRTGPLRTVGAETLPKGRIALSFQFEYFDFDEFSNRELLAFAAAGEDVHSTDSVFHGFLTGSYGITEDLTLSLKLPYVYIDNVRESHADEPGEVHVHGDAKGLGDISIFGQYRFFDAEDFQASMMLGLKIPTGRTTDKDIENVRFETEFQPGSGSWDPLFGVALQKSLERVSFNTSLHYMIATEGSQDTDLGDAFSYNAAVGYNVYKGKFSWDLILEANGEFKQKEEVRGIDDQNSGGNIILVSPGTRITWNNRLAAFLSVGFPVVQDLNGIQNDINNRILTGLSFAF